MITAAILTFAIAGFTACSDDNENMSTAPGADGSGTVSMYMTDAPGDYEQALITYSEVSLRSSADAWTTVSSDTNTIDLLTVTNGQTELIGQVDVESGVYNQVRLKIESAQVVKDGQTYDVTVPSGASSGLKINGNVNVQADLNTGVVLDFNVASSFVEQGNGNIMMNPVIRVAVMDNTGTISGTVSTPQDGLVVYAVTTSGDTVSTTYANETSGQFKLSFLPSGSYKVVVKDTSNTEVYMESQIAVTAGATATLGMIDLNIGGEAEGTMQTYWTDAPGDYEQVLVTYTDVSARSETGTWTTLSSESNTIDMMTVTNGETQLIAENSVEAANYDMFGVSITAVQVVKNGTTYDVEVPNSATTGMTLMGDVDVNAESETGVVFDFDAARSIVKSEVDGSYSLTPVVRVAAMDNTGHIEGTVNNSTAGLAAYAIVAATSDTVSSTFVNETSGEFRISYLPQDNYTVVVKDSTDAMLYIESNISVGAGQISAMGSFDLDFDLGLGLN